MKIEQEIKPLKRRVLVVDDDPGVRASLTYFLEEWDVEVLAVQDGHTALAIFAGKRFDLIFVDLYMPGMTGLEMAALVRRLDPGIPIILITGWASTLEAIAVAAAGITRVLPKPFPMDELATCLRLMHGACPPAKGSA
jgi:two-component system response regulator PilR (NtrC family)